MLVKAVAHHTTASFIRVVGSEFVQKYLGEGPRMVRDVFRMARENAPAIIFIDEIDAIATKRFDAQTGADREVQRILLELLNQMDGFDQGSNVKVIMATNRADTLVSAKASSNERLSSCLWLAPRLIRPALPCCIHDHQDPALLRPGRLDRKIEFPNPSRREKRLIFQTITSKMSMGADVDLEDCELARVKRSDCLVTNRCVTCADCILLLLLHSSSRADVQRPDKLSSAEISSICQAAGLQAVRKNR